MKNFFKNISWVQILAGALAAVTVFFFSTKIGLAGSIIGVAVASIISTLSSQIYQNVLKVSSKKIKNVRSDGTDSDSDGKPRVASSAESTQRIDPAVMPVAFAAGATAGVSKSKVGESTAVMKPVGQEKGTSASIPELTPPPLPKNAKSSGPSDSVSQTRVMPAATKAAEASSKARIRIAAGSSLESKPQSFEPKGSAEKSAASSDTSKTNHRKVIIVSVISGLVAVGITVALILLFTGGQGTDSIVRDAVSNSQTPSHQEQQQKKPTAPEPKKDSKDTTSDSNKDSSSSTSGDSSGSSSDGTSKDNTGSTDKGTTDSGTSGSTGTGDTGSGSGGSSTSGGSTGSTDGSGTTDGKKDTGSTGSGSSSTQNQSGSGSTTPSQ